MTTTEAQTADLLADLPALLAEEPAVRAVIDRAPVVAVPEPARALYLAALARVTTRRPILVTVPTAAEAERVAHDLTRYLGRDAGVELFPAWETLPFERVSPSLDTMGRRLRVIWKLRAGGEQLPDVVVAPVRALVQRLGPHVEDVEPIRVHPGAQLDRDALVNRLVAFGYRREYQVEARGEVAVRGSIVDVYPATDDHPVRIDLWGDEVDRLSRFSVADQRSTDEIDESWVFPARELVPSDEVRERAARLVGSEPWGREQWERLADGQVFDGMESWLPWLSDREHLLPDLLPDDALVLLVEPKRTRDRAQELLDEEASLGSTLSATWGATGREFPRLSLPFDRLLAHTKAGATGKARKADVSKVCGRSRSACWQPQAGARHDARAAASRLSRPRRRRQSRRRLHGRERTHPLDAERRQGHQAAQRRRLSRVLLHQPVRRRARLLHRGRAQCAARLDVH